MPVPILTYDNRMKSKQHVSFFRDTPVYQYILICHLLRSGYLVADRGNYQATAYSCLRCRSATCARIFRSGLRSAIYSVHLRGHKLG